MKKLFLPTLLALLCATSPLMAQKITRLDASRFGVRAVAGYDNGPALAKLLTEARRVSDNGDSVVIHLAPGAYTVLKQSLAKETLYISNHDHMDERPVALLLQDLHHTTIDAQDVTFLLHGRLLPVVVKGCSDVTLSGFTIDYPRPALSQLEILSVEGDEVTARLPEETKSHIEDGNRLVVDGEGYTNTVQWTMPFRADGRMKWGRADIGLFPKSIEQISDRTLLIKGWDESPHLAVGDRYVLRSWARPTPAITIIDSSDVSVIDVTVHYAEGMGLLAQDSRDLTLERFSVRVPKGSDRFFTTQADATHFSNCRGFIHSTEGLYEHMADDAINVHGVYLRVDSLLSDRQVLATFAHEQAFGLTWGEVGDTIRFVDRETLLPLHTTTVAALESPDPHHKVISLAEPLPEERPEQMAVENYSAMPTVLFSRNVVRNNRARGALFSTHRSVVCSDNLFDHTHGSAILLSGDANGWYESGPCEEVLIRGNHFVNALTAKYQFTNGVISIFPVLNRVVPGEYYHGRVVVEGNTFDTFPSPLLYALSVRELIFRDNVVRRNHSFESLFDDPTSQLTNVGSVVYTSSVE